jgi:LysR family transcriptional regulator, cys regulon transcriptional activator
MNLHQLRFAWEAAKRNLNLTETAKALHTSQPGVSKAILELEEELGIDIFVRHGKRLKRITEPGQHVLASIDIILREISNLKRIGAEYAMQDAGTLSIATTHTQARYVLPEPVAGLKARYPKVLISLHQGTPEQVAQMVLDDIADVGLATESLADFDGLITLPAYEWQHVAVMPKEHPLANTERLSLEQLALHPLISYHPSFTGRSRIDHAFAVRGLQPNVVLEAIDADVIKTYTRLGMGIGLVAEMAVQDDPAFAASGAMVALPVGHLFGSNIARLAFKRGGYLRQFVFTFAQLLAPRLSTELITQALQGQANNTAQKPSDDVGL